jgi:hypothetical protein
MDPGLVGLLHEFFGEKLTVGGTVVAGGSSSRWQDAWLCYRFSLVE